MSPTVKKVLLGLAGLVAAWAVIGFLLPGTWRVESSREVRAKPEVIYWYVDSYDGWIEWSEWQRHYYPDMEFAPGVGSPPSGTGMVLTWTHSGRAPGHLEITESEPYRHVSYVMEEKSVGLELHGDFSLEPTEAGTKITWSENGTIPANPFYRWMALFTGGVVESQFDEGLGFMQQVAEARAAELAARSVTPGQDDPEAADILGGGGATYEGP